MTSRILLGAGLAALAASQASAQTIYTDRAAFEAAITGAVTDDFEENGPGTFTSYGSRYTGSTFTITGEDMYTVDPGFSPMYDWGTGDVFDFEFSTGTITVAAGITALGFDFGNPEGDPQTVTINGVDYSLLGQPTFNFWGIVGIAPTATINWNGGIGIMDNVTTNAVPEPSTWAIMLLGFLAIGSAMRSRRARQALHISYT